MATPVQQSSHFSIRRQNSCSTFHGTHIFSDSSIFIYCLLNQQLFLSCLIEFRLNINYILTLVLLIDQVGRVFANGPGGIGSILGRVILKILKMVLDTSLPNTQHYKVRIKSKWSNLGKEVPPCPTSRCRGYWKEVPQVALDYGHQLYFLSSE